MNQRVPFKFVALAFVLVGIFALVVYNRRPDVGFDDRPVTMEQRRQQAAEKGELEFAQAITNTVGWRRTLEARSHIYEDQPATNWWASARVEIINRQGGVEAVDLKFAFGQYSDRVVCVPVSEESYQNIVSRTGNNPVD
jgi:hypothetical protein